MGDNAWAENFCIVCDRLIAAPHEPEVAEKKQPKKKAQGAIRIKNADGSTTIRTANGVKTTRPPLRRFSSTTPSEGKSTTESTPARKASPEPAKPVTAPAFVSNIYCSRKCAEQDAGASGPEAYESMARVFGLGVTSSSDAVVVPGHLGTMSPPSPLLGSDTDVSSAASTSIASITASPASVPKTMGVLRPEDKDLARQRRSSLVYASRFSITSLEPLAQTAQQMSRQRSSTSTSNGRPRSTASAASTDSLMSLGQSDMDVSMNRNMSSNGAVPYRRTSSDCPATAPRPLLARSSVSQVSLGPHAPSSLSLGAFTSSEASSVPSQAAVLIHSYASAFPARDGSPMLKPVPGVQSPDLRSSSVSNTPSVNIRSRPRTGSGPAGSWDAFGKAEVIERSRRNARLDRGASTDLTREPSSPELTFWRERADSVGHDATPKQSLEDGCWQIRYTRQSNRQESRSRSASREPRTAIVPEDAVSHAKSTARPIPERAHASSAIAGSTLTARSRTPQWSRIARSTPAPADADLATMASLHMGPPASPVVSPQNASPSSRSMPRAGFDWTESQHRTYELPPGVVVNPNKGLFYFKA